MKKDSSLKKKTIAGLLWSLGDMMGNQGVQFIIQIILARLLLPEHFGLIGMIMVFIAISNSLINSGFTQALIREQNSTQTDYSTVFYFNMAVSLLIYMGLYFSAPMISNFYGEPELVQILRILSLGIILNALAIIPRAIFAKEVNFKVVAKVNMIASSASGVFAVAAALAGFGVWSLIIRTLAMSFIQSFLLLIEKRWIPSVTFSMVSFKRLFGFGWKILASGMINTVYKNIFFLIIGKQHSATQLGYYTNAFKLSDLTTYTLTSTIERVSYPVLSSIQNEQERLKQAFRKLVKLSAFLIFPIMIGLAAIADPLVLLLFGEKWMPMVIYFQLLCLAGMLFPIQEINLSVLQVKGRSDMLLYLEITKIILSLVLIFTVIWMDLGIVFLVSVVVVDAYIALFLDTYFTGKQVSYPAREQLKDLAPIYFVSMAMGFVVLNVGGLFEGHVLLQMLLQISTGIIFYILFSLLLKIEELKTIYNLIVPVIRKRLFKES